MTPPCKTADYWQLVQRVQQREYPQDDHEASGGPVRNLSRATGDPELMRSAVAGLLALIEEQ